MNIIEILNLVHEYKEYDENETEVETVRAIDDVTLSIEEGSFVTIVGHNGSGKSTLAKHVNALLLPTGGTVLLCGQDTMKTEELWTLRKNAGMVFQNPDNQIIAGIVEEDVAFGPENLGVPTEELERRVEQALERVGMTAFRMNSPNRLSGGQKQRIAIAGMLAMKPKCILMDEPTAMLDPVGRKEVIETVHELNREEGITIVLITHYMEEAVDADRVIVMDGGKLVMDGTPREVFSRVEELKACRMTVPQVTELAHELRKEGVELPEGILTIDEFTEALWKLARAKIPE
ncbi:MAG: energy-coupling factor transporter ATPase [Lachnospiraceae bacterium]|nr:energy-coupling factor transporter ATPase [Lachnospiraceae bacterium]